MYYSFYLCLLTDESVGGKNTDCNLKNNVSLFRLLLSPINDSQDNSLKYSEGRKLTNPLYLLNIVKNLQNISNYWDVKWGDSLICIDYWGQCPNQCKRHWFSHPGI